MDSLSYSEQHELTAHASFSPDAILSPVVTHTSAISGGHPLPNRRPSKDLGLKANLSGRPSSAASGGHRSNDSEEGGERRNSMTRLPDDPPGCSVASSLGRPGSASKTVAPAGLVRLPDDHVAGQRMSSSNGQVRSSSRPTSSSGSRKASLARLPDEVLHIASSGDQSERLHGGSKLSAMRDRLNKDLTVSTTKKEKDGQKPAPRVFRTLKEGEAITDYYEFAEEIYSGGAKGKVCCAKQRSDGSEVVVKMRMKNPSKMGERTWRTIMSQVYGIRTKHVLDIIDIFEDSNAFYVIMPKCNGGELFEFLATETEVPEVECKRIIREILIAVRHLHENNLVHRDIKPENIMFDLDRSLPTSPKTVKLIDFDTCLGWAVGTPKSRRFVGTPGYIAPEALLGEIRPQSDLWSIGVILYILMTGEMPWSTLVSLEDGVVGSPGATRMYDALKKEVLDWDKEPWPEFPQARDLCQKLMAFDVDERIGACEEALAHPWLSGS